METYRAQGSSFCLVFSSSSTSLPFFFNRPLLPPLILPLLEKSPPSLFLFRSPPFSLFQSSSTSQPLLPAIRRTPLPEPTSHQPPEKKEKRKKQRNSPLLRSLRGGSTIENLNCRFLAR